MRALIFDPFAGISGDMMLGALIDLGLEPEWLESFVASLGLPDVRVEIGRTSRRAIACGRVTFDLPHQHAHRHLRHVIDIVDRSPASGVAKVRARDAFTRIATAEARIHGTTIEKVHFHEVGALDSILDVLCTMAAVEHMAFEAFFTRPVAVGRGWVDIEHGRFPVPAPATLELLAGLPLTGWNLEGECTTPTGAAIIATLADRGDPGQMAITTTGFGAGTRDPEDRPNCLRLIAAEIDDARSASIPAESLWIVQSDIDDMAPEYLPPAQDALFAAGARDVTTVQVSMKKGRPGVRLEALVDGTALEGVLEALFRNTPTIGARYWPVSRPALPREEHTVEWHGQRIRLKRVTLPGGGSRSKPEYDDVARAAAALGMTPFEVRRGLDSATGGDGPG
jgi:pyridinium-3,5-bisthiocarboxylic acid mononucleotide nickel chelatase